MAIIGKLMGTRPGMSAPRTAPKPDPVFSRPSLDFLTGGKPKQTLPADALDRDALIQDILSKIEVPSAPVFDPTGLQARLAELEGRETPVFDPSALEKQIADLRQRPGRDDFMSIERQLQDLQNREIPQFDPSNLQEQIGGLQQQIGNIPQFDDSALRDRLQALEGREIPQFDPTNLQSQIGGLQDRLANIPQFDPSALQEQIGGLEERLANIPAFDPSGLQNRLKTLESREIPQFDPSQLQAGIQGLSKRIANLPQFDDTALRDRLQALEGREIPQFDDSALRDRLQALESREIPTFDPSQLQQGIAGLEDRLKNIPQFDPSALQQQIEANRNLLSNIPQFDDSALRERLKSLEGREMPQFDPTQLQAGIQGLSERISNLPQFDPSALQNRLSALENRQAPTFNPEDFREQFLNIAREGIDIPQPAAPDLSGFAKLEDLPTFDRDAIIRDIRSGIDIPQAPTIDREALIKDITGRIQVPKPPSIDRESIIRDIQDRIKIPTPGTPFDPSKLQERLANLESRETPKFDPTKLRERLAALENREPAPVAPAFDPSGLQARLRALESRKPVAPPPAFDPSGLQNRLQALESREMPQFDPSRLQERLSALENVQPVTAPPAFDPSRLQARLDALENREPVAPPPAFDPSSIQERLAALENRQPVAPPAFDTSAIDQRFEDIARQLAELQSAQAQPSPDPVVPPVQPLPVEPVAPPETPLPIQPPGDLDLGIKQDRPDPRDFAKPLPGGGTIYDESPLKRPLPGGDLQVIGGGQRLLPSPFANFSPEEQARRDEQKNLSSQISSATKDFFAAFPDAPKPPRVGTMDVRIFTDPITGEQKQGSSTDLRYRNSLKAFLDANPAAQSSYNENVVTPQKRLIDLRGGPGQGPIFTPIGGPALLPGRERPTPPMSIGGPGGGVGNMLYNPGGPIPLRDDIMFPGGSSTFDERGETFVPPTPVTPTPDPVVEPTPDPVATPTGEPAAPPPAPTIPTPPGSVDPIIMGQTADEVVTDPLIRALYFGTPDQPGFFNQLQQVGANLLGAQAPGTEYDPSMTEKFFNPFENRVVQQTIEDVLKAGEQRDIAQRAQDIGRGGLSAFGSRARLTADERQEALGRGLGQALAGIRQSGFSEAQRTGLSEFDRQYGRDISQLYRPLDVLRGIGGLLPGYTQATSRIGTTYGMPQDPSALGLGAALSTYASLAPQTGSAFDNYGQTTGQG